MTAATAELPPPTSSHDRLGFAVLLAAALHAAVILGITFEREARQMASTRLDITLAQYRSDTKPDRADFLAQENQEGSGTLEEKAQLTTTEEADFHDNVIREVTPQQQPMAAQPPGRSQQELVTTRSASSRQVAPSNEEADSAAAAAGDVTIIQRSLEIASLEAKLDQQRQAYAARPRIRRLTSVATRRSEDALYLHNWRTRIEQIGNANYPARARQQQLFGDLRLLVSLFPNGEVKEIKVLKSSGHKVLDEAAIRIVRLAEPYAPFPTAMARQVDVLEIIRTWRFHRGVLSSES